MRSNDRRLQKESDALLFREEVAGMDWIVEHIVIIHLNEPFRQAGNQVQILFHCVAIESWLVLFGDELVLIDPFESMLMLSLPCNGCLNLSRYLGWVKSIQFGGCGDTR